MSTDTNKGMSQSIAFQIFENENQTRFTQILFPRRHYNSLLERKLDQAGVLLVIRTELTVVEVPVVTIFTARNEVGARLCFSRVCDSVHRGVSGPHPGEKLRGLAGGSPGPHPGGRLRGLTEGGWAVSKPTPGRVSRPTQGGGCASLHAGIHSTPPPDGYCSGRYASHWNAL